MKENSYANVAAEIQHRICTGQIKVHPPVSEGDGQKRDKVGVSLKNNHQEWSPHYVKDQYSEDKYREESYQAPREYSPFGQINSGNCDGDN